MANAIYDGTGAIMLSGETAAGLYPVESLLTMIKIADRTEQDIDYRKRFFSRERKANPDVTDAICHIAKYCPACDIICGAMDEKVARQISMVWGTVSVILEKQRDVFDLFDHAIEKAEEEGFLSKGDMTVITSGVPIGVSGTTNMIKVQEV